VLLSINDTITVGDISTELALNYNSKQSLFNGVIAPISPIRIAMVTDALRWGNEAGQDATNLRGLANYLIWLCGAFGLEARAKLGLGGGNVISGSGQAGTTIFPIVVTAANFEVDGITLNDPRIVGVNLFIVPKNFVQEQLFAPTWFTYTATGIVLANGLNANDFESITIEKYTTL
jgi:hypothetical protein